MNILICDDANDDAQELKCIINESHPEINVATCCSAPEALEYISQSKVPFACFLDVLMPGMDGISLAEQLRENGYNGHIVFLTISSDFAVKSYKVKAFSYLIKPAEKSEVLRIIHELKEAFKTADTQGIPIKTRKMAGIVLFQDLSHVEVSSHKVYFRLTNGEEIAVNASLSEIAPKLLLDSRFIQCHGSFVVNMDEIKTISGQWIMMRCGAKIPVSKRFFSAKEKIVKWIFREEEKK
ncbi:MAG: LytTR family DNA-binding domain-containing protein [Treponema sp.]|nr:LytTR family DNA-binding domain-containing protein [Treponema sp.]